MSLSLGLGDLRPGSVRKQPQLNSSSSARVGKSLGAVRLPLGLRTLLLEYEIPGNWYRTNLEALQLAS
uniref:Uncharacterized protein n=1 Tax=Colobus angolensis palliatus TaxID=336983 RepID=A0A2K5HNL8_COLAP